jgi:hypothetical protein
MVSEEPSIMCSLADDRAQASAALSRGVAHASATVYFVGEVCE